MFGRYKFSELMGRSAVVVEELQTRRKGRFGELPKYAWDAGD